MLRWCTAGISSSSPRRCKQLLAGAVVIAATLMTLPTPATAAKSAKERNPETLIKKKGVNKVTHQRSPSEESRAERDRRLYRECKGMHNAGACQGYTR
jgi:uridylate kinase